MKRLFDKLPVPLFILLIIPLFVIAIPLAVIDSMINEIMEPKRRNKLNEAVQQRWLPAQKYVYVIYDTSFVLTEYLEEVLLPKYNKFVIADKWSPEKGKWSYNFPDDENRLNSVAGDVLDEYFEEPGLQMVGLLKDTHSFDTDNALRFYEDGPDSVLLNGKSISMSEAQEAFSVAISEVIAAWESGK